MSDFDNDNEMRAAFDRLSANPPLSPDRVAAVHAKATRLRHRRALMAAGTAAVVVAAGLGIAIPLSLSSSRQDSAHLHFTNPSPSAVPTVSTPPTASPTPTPAAPPTHGTADVTTLSSGSFLSTTAVSEVGSPFNAFTPGPEAQPMGAFGANCTWGTPDPSPRAAGDYTYWVSSGDFEDSGVVVDEYLIASAGEAAASKTLSRLRGWLDRCSAFRAVRALPTVHGEVYLHVGKSPQGIPNPLPGYTAIGRQGNVVALVEYGSQGQAPSGGTTSDRIAKVEIKALGQAHAPVTRVRAVPSAKGDIDGDGRLDEVTISPAADGNGYRVTARLTRLGTQTVTVQGSTQGGQIIGVQDMDGDGYADVVVRFDHGASTDFWTIVRLVNGKLVQLTLDGQPVALAVGGSATHTGGFSCNANYPDVWDPGFLRTNGLEFDGTTWRGEFTTYRYDGSRLVKVSSHTEHWTGKRTSLEQKYGAGVVCGALPQSAPWTPPPASPTP